MFGVRDVCEILGTRWWAGIWGTNLWVMSRQLREINDLRARWQDWESMHSLSMVMIPELKGRREVEVCLLTRQLASATGNDLVTTKKRRYSDERRIRANTCLSSY